jgi:hypothetical protein
MPKLPETSKQRVFALFTRLGELEASVKRVNHDFLTVIFKSKSSISTKYNNETKHPRLKENNYMDCILNDPRHDLKRPALIPKCNAQIESV